MGGVCVSALADLAGIDGEPFGVVAVTGVDDVGGVDDEVRSAAVCAVGVAVAVAVVAVAVDAGVVVVIVVGVEPVEEDSTEDEGEELVAEYAAVSGKYGTIFSAVVFRIDARFSRKRKKIKQEIRKINTNEKSSTPQTNKDQKK